MKQLFFLLTLMSIASFSFSQNKNNILASTHTAIGVSSVQPNAWNGLNEAQLASLYQVLQAGKIALPQSRNISAYDAVQLIQFADSLSNVLTKQYAEWHPAPVPKTDTAVQKPVSEKK